MDGVMPKWKIHYAGSGVWWIWRINTGRNELIARVLGWRNAIRFALDRINELSLGLKNPAPRDGWRQYPCPENPNLTNCERLDRAQAVCKY